MNNPLMPVLIFIFVFSFIMLFAPDESDGNTVELNKETNNVTTVRTF